MNIKGHCNQQLRHDLERCAEKRQHGRPELAILRQACLQGGPCLTQLLNSFLHDAKLSLNDRNGSVPILCTMWFMLNTCFPSESLQYWYIMVRYLCHQPPIKILGIGSLMSFPVENTLHLLQLITREITDILCDSTGRELLEAFAWFLPDCHISLSLCRFCLHSFAEINLSHEYDYIHYSPVSSLVNHLTQGWRFILQPVHHSSFHITEREHAPFSLTGQSFQCLVYASRMHEWNFA